MDETQQPSSGRTAPRQAGPDASAEDAAHWLAALVNSSDAILSKTLDGVITSWNTAAQQIYGYSADEIIGQSVSLLIPPERLDEFNEIMRRLRQGEQIDHLETARVCRDGRRIDVSVTISPIIDGHNQIIGISTIARDITARKQAEEALRRAHDELEAKVAERARELAVRNQQLHAEIAERKRAEAARRESSRRIETILESITTPSSPSTVSGATLTSTSEPWAV